MECEKTFERMPWNIFEISDRSSEVLSRLYTQRRTWCSLRQRGGECPSEKWRGQFINYSYDILMINVFTQKEAINGSMAAWQKWRETAIKLERSNSIRLLVSVLGRFPSVLADQSKFNRTTGQVRASLGRNLESVIYDGLINGKWRQPHRTSCTPLSVHRLPPPATTRLLE